LPQPSKLMMRVRFPLHAPTSPYASLRTFFQRHPIQKFSPFAKSIVIKPILIKLILFKLRLTNQR
ncbi:hypothetical protein AB6D55_22975, partial [Vibrio splendidus]